MQKEAKIVSSSPLSDYDAITRTVQHYINGGKTGKTDEMKLAFHPQATIFGYIVQTYSPVQFKGCLTGTIRMAPQPNWKEGSPVLISSRLSRPCV